MKLTGLSIPSAQPSIDDRIMPLINIVFLLLIFFLVAGVIREPDPIEVEPPASAAEETSLPEALNVYVDADGTIALEDRVLSSLELQAEITRQLSKAPETVIRIVADQSAETVNVIEMLDNLRDAGATHVKLATRYVEVP